MEANESDRCREHERVSKYKPTFLLVALLLLLTSCTSPGKQGTVPAATQLPTSVPTPTATPTPIPPTPTVGPVPHNCPVSHPVPQSISPNLAPAIGSSPVWATWAPGPSIFHLTPLPNSNTYIPSYGWAITKAIWEVGPNYTHPVTVRGHDLFNHTPLLIQIDDTPTASAVLDPQHPNHPVSVIGTDWAEWGSYIVVPKAGCYVMEVSWPTGRWTITLAFGA